MGLIFCCRFRLVMWLKNLICYKNQPFALDTRSDTPYYVCQLQQYAVKVYDKGKQNGLACNLLRIEIRVKKMEYFNGTGVRLAMLADLLNVVNYGPLGTLLVDTFNEILFADPSINPNSLIPQEKKIYQDGCNPRFWQMPDDLTPQQAVTYRQRLSRAKRRYRALLDQHGGYWQKEVATLMGQTWQELTTYDDNLLTRINDYRGAWEKLPLNRNQPVTPGENCHKLTEPTSSTNGKETGNMSGSICHKLTDSQNATLSQNNPLYSGLDCDTLKPDNTPGESTPGAVVCPVTGIALKQPRRGQRFVSATMLHSDDDLMLTLQSRFKQYRKGSKEDQFSRAAHNLRNDNSNPRNNLRRSINKIHCQPTLFDVSDTLRLTADQRAALDHWRGTPYEVTGLRSS